MKDLITCDQAVAYLKLSNPDSTGVEISVADDDEPVITDLENGLAVLYLVD